MNYVTTASEKIASKSATIGVIGLGYVGLPLVLRFSSVGFKVVGFDVDEDKVQCLETRRTYLDHIPSEKLKSELRPSSRFTTDFSLIKEVDAIIICVPTPLGRHNEPDLSFVTTTIESIVPYLCPGQIISLESTTYPGTTEEEIVSRQTKISASMKTSSWFILRKRSGNKSHYR